MKLPKKIWFLWLQGFDNMPYLVQKCWTSWQYHNSDWEITFLDKENIYEYIDIKSVLEDRTTRIYPVTQSEIIRINLLEKYGGVWVDATCFCQQPLDNWIYDYLDSGFFAFNRPGKDRMLSSWFLAATPYNKLVKIYCKEVNNFWLTNKTIKAWIDKPLVHQIILRFKIHGYLKNNPTLWFHPIITKVIRIYPYFWFFYLFEKLYHSNQEIKNIWDLTPKFSADVPHKIQNFGFFQSVNGLIRHDIDQKISPLYKLTYKYDPKKLKEGSALHYLLTKQKQF